MSAPENPNSGGGSDAEMLNEMRSAIEALRGVFQVVALSGIALSCTLLLFFYREVKQVRRQNTELKAFVNEYNTNVWPKVDIARTNLEAFAKTNPTFVPIYRKYFSTNTGGTNPAPAKP
jgi:hypothetical protein